MAGAKRVLLLNPLIHDYCAHDFWAKPLGLFELGARLRAAGFEVRLLDLTNPVAPGLDQPLPRHLGQGKWPKTPIPRPPLLPDLGRRFYRFGWPLPQVRGRTRHRAARPIGCCSPRP